jgi:hypothetical protein
MPGSHPFQCPPRAVLDLCSNLMAEGLSGDLPRADSGHSTNRVALRASLLGIIGKLHQGSNLHHTFIDEWAYVTVR